MQLVSPLPEHFRDILVGHPHARPGWQGVLPDRYLGALPGRIEQLEADIAARTAAMQDPAFYRQDANAQQRANAELAAQQAELDAAYARWEALDG